MRRLLFAIAAFALTIGSGIAADSTAAEPTPAEKLVFFEKEVRPLLVQHCQKCHGEKLQKGKLRLDQYDAMLAGGESGPAVVPGDLRESLMIDAINHRGPKMPPDGKLPAAQIATLTKWIELGAPWPENDRGPFKRPVRHGAITEEDRKWWAIQPVRSPAPPTVADRGWARGDLDRFIFQRLAAEGLSPAPEADKRTLIRRLCYDLTGLPPTPEQVAAFVSDDSPQAYEQLVERLLASPRFGERWARHWLDLVRYADSDGYRLDEYRPQAWRYRDYVVRAFNDDKPYDRFIEEQLAGDELFPGNPEALTATGYLRNGIYEYNARDVRGQWRTILEDVTDTTADVFLGLGLQCAKCHDHKFDPLLQKDYYRLQAFFASMLPREELVAATDADQAAYRERLKEWEAKSADLRKQIDEIEAGPRKSVEDDAISKFPEEIQAMIRKPVADRSTLEHQLAELAFRQITYEWAKIDTKIAGPAKEKYLALRKELADLDKLKPEPLPVVLGVLDMPAAGPVLVPKRGKEPIEPGYPTILDDKPAEIAKLPQSPGTTGRRAALAKWLARPENPLTARVMVNRIWQQYFGRGLAANTSDFGRLGEPPTHPELLDWLAGRLVASGWSLKSIHRQIVLSAAYRQSATHPELAAGKLKDPENRFLWRANVRRLDAEEIRDSLYAASGELKADQLGGPGIAGEGPRRSIYLRVLRNNRHPILEAFDAPFWLTSAASRDTTTTPVQSLLMINGQFFQQRAESLARDVDGRLKTAGEDAKIAAVFERVYGRPPGSGELAEAREFLREQVRRIDPKSAAAPEADFLYDKLPYRDGQAAVVSTQQGPMQVGGDKPMSLSGDFTVEMFFLARSVFETGGVRTALGQWNGDEKVGGWAFGVTGKKSRRKPQTLVMQLIGDHGDGKIVHEPVFSDQHIALNKPYYAAAAVKFATDKEPGLVTFYVKDLSNDDEPLLVAKVEHQIRGGVKTTEPLLLGGRGGASDSRFDGLIDDIRVSQSSLGVDRLLFTNEGVLPQTLGYWKFDPSPDAFADASGQGHRLQPRGAAAAKVRVDPAKQAWADWCHVLLNSNEFLYVK